MCPLLGFVSKKRLGVRGLCHRPFIDISMCDLVHEEGRMKLGWCLCIDLAKLLILSLSTPLTLQLTWDRICAHVSEVVWGSYIHYFV
jgi:hypothetical protein